MKSYNTPTPWPSLHPHALALTPPPHPGPHSTPTPWPSLHPHTPALTPPPRPGPHSTPTPRPSFHSHTPALTPPPLTSNVLYLGLAWQVVQYIVQQLQSSVQRDLHPARCLLDALTPVVRPPALHEAQSQDTETSQVVYSDALGHVRFNANVA